MPLPETDPLVWAPLGVAKAVEGVGKERRVYVTVSTPRVDHEGERIATEAMQAGWDYHRRHGRLTWEHLTPETRHDPSILIGEPLRAAWPGGQTHVEYW